MSEIVSRLTAANRKDLAQLLGKVNLHLLYKASVHGFAGKYFYEKCGGQGPTITVGYNKPGLISGGYTSQDFCQNSSEVDNKAFLFGLSTHGSGEKPRRFAVKADTVAVYNDVNSGPNFGHSLLFLLLSRQIQERSGNFKGVGKNVLFGSNVNLVECEVYRVEELKTPWRHLTWTTERRQEQIDFIKNYTPYKSLTSQARVLLIGPNGGGKSSFINSVNSIFRGHVTNRVMVGGESTRTTTKYSTYSFRGEKDGISLPLILCDTMGLTEPTLYGMHSDDVIRIIKGHVPNKYQFNTASPIQVDTKNSIKPTTIDEKIHCVAYVLDASKPLSSQMEQKICSIKSQINDLEIPQIVLLTKVDKECILLDNDLENVYRSDLIEEKVLEVGNQLAVPVSNIIPVKNYWSNHDLHCATDILLLSALIHILHSVDDYLENIDPDW
ncbi:interferon-induced protein 44-like isoform X1 [Scyliorhinus canicula]|uniref:interferon-induced protein 44-like isoform X1 n=1 Tax=Scyliorhinus canicula TaxID=7830 RepID=UPI0018F5006C|nr:interferon-induced protein 44-like isoform X1 [Scyliorhinus canicula]